MIPGPIKTECLPPRPGGVSTRHTYPAGCTEPRGAAPRRASWRVGQAKKAVTTSIRANAATRPKRRSRPATRGASFTGQRAGSRSCVTSDVTVLTAYAVLTESEKRRRKVLGGAREVQPAGGPVLSDLRNALYGCYGQDGMLGCAVRNERRECQELWYPGRRTTRPICTSSSRRCRIFDMKLTHSSISEVAIG